MKSVTKVKSRGKNENIELIGFIGQGWIGKNYADTFEENGYDVIRYSLDKEYVSNKDKIKDCKFVFIAVPTPTTKKGFDVSYVDDALSCVGKGNIAIIKSTMSPGSTNKLALKHKGIYVVHSPEFLREASASYDARHPDRNIIGIPFNTAKYKQIANEVLKILPQSNHQMIMTAKEAELVKYAGNCFLYTKVVFFNILYDLAKSNKIDFEVIRNAVGKDPRIGEGHTKVLHNSGHTKKQGRGAGGHCFIKDFEAYINFTKESLNSPLPLNILKSTRDYNNDLLIKSNKDLDLLENVIGKLKK